MPKEKNYRFHDLHTHCSKLGWHNVNLTNRTYQTYLICEKKFVRPWRCLSYKRALLEWCALKRENVGKYFLNYFQERVNQKHFVVQM